VHFIVLRGHQLLRRMYDLRFQDRAIFYAEIGGSFFLRNGISRLPCHFHTFAGRISSKSLGQIGVIFSILS
jgi:hypothetical protein